MHIVAGHSGNLRGAGHPPIDCTAGTPSMCNVQLTTPRMLQAQLHFACVECDAPAHFTHVQHTTQHDEHPAGHLINWFVLLVTPPVHYSQITILRETHPHSRERERERERQRLEKEKRQRGGKIGKRMKETNMRMPGVEPGSQAWEACMIPLHYMRNW